MKFFVAAEIFINFARGLFTLALGMLLYQATDSLWAFALTFISEFIVALFLQGIAGTLVDRYGAVKVLAVALLASTLALLVGFAFRTGSDTTMLIILAIFLNVTRPFIRNGVFSLTPQVAGTQLLEKLNGLISISLQLGQMSGMAAAGFLLELYGGEYIVLATLGGYLLATACYMRLFLLFPKQTRGTDTDKKELPGWRQVALFIKENSRIRIVLLCSSFDYMAIALFNILLAPAVEKLFDGQERWLSYLDISFALAALAGGIVVTKKNFTKEARLGLSMLAMLSVLSVFSAYLLAVSATVIIISCIGFGFFVTLSTVFWLSEIQRDTPESIRGRIGSLRYIVNSLNVIVATTIVSTANDIEFSSALVAAIGIVLLAIVVLLSVGCKSGLLFNIFSKIQNKYRLL